MQLRPKTRLQLHKAGQGPRKSPLSPPLQRRAVFPYRQPCRIWSQISILIMAGVAIRRLHLHLGINRRAPCPNQSRVPPAKTQVDRQRPTCPQKPARPSRPPLLHPAHAGSHLLLTALVRLEHQYLIQHPLVVSRGRTSLSPQSPSVAGLRTAICPEGVRLSNPRPAGVKQPRRTWSVTWVPGNGRARKCSGKLSPASKDTFPT